MDFTQIGTKSSKASIIANDDKIEIDPDTQSIPWTDIKSSTIDLHYPRHRCKLLNNDDVIFLDSPGVRKFLPSFQKKYNKNQEQNNFRKHF